MFHKYIFSAQLYGIYLQDCLSIRDKHKMKYGMFSISFTFLVTKEKLHKNIWDYKRRGISF